MANNDDVNKNKKQVNGMDPGLSHILERYTEKQKQPSIVELEAKERIFSLEEAIGRYTQKHINGTDQSEVINAMTQRIADLRIEAVNAAENRMYTATKAATSQIGTYYKDVNFRARAGQLSRSQEAIVNAATLPYSYDETIAQQHQQMQLKRQLRDDLTRKINSNAPREEIEAIGSQLSETERTYGSLMAREKLLNKLGSNPTSEIYATINASSEARKYLERRESGQIGEGGSQAQKEHIKQLDEVSKKLKDFAEALEQGKLTTEELTDYKKAQQRFTELRNKTISGDGGGFSDSYKNIIGPIAGAATNASQQLLVNLPIREANANANLANIQNQKYDLMQRAAQGDQSAILLLGKMGQIDAESLFTGAMGGAGTAMKGILGVADTAMAVRGLKTGIPNVGDIANSAGGAINSFASVGVATKETMAMSWNAKMQEIRAYNAIPSDISQSNYDYNMTSLMATRGMGSARLATFNNLGSSATIEKLMQLGVGSKDLGQYASNIVNVQGGDVASSSAGILRQIETARNLEIAGYGNKSELITSMGKLATSGNVTDPSMALARIMEDAISKGFDKSKMSDLVDSVATIAESTGVTGGGIQAGGLSGLLAGALGSNDPNMNDKSELRMATKSVISANQAASDTRISWASMMNLNQQMGITGDIQSAFNLQKAGPAALSASVQELMGLTPGSSEYKTAAGKLIGIGGSGLLNNGVLDVNKAKKSIRASQRMVLEGGAGGANFQNYSVLDKFLDRANELNTQGIPLEQIQEQLTKENPRYGNIIGNLGDVGGLRGVLSLGSKATSGINTDNANKIMNGFGTGFNATTIGETQAGAAGTIEMAKVKESLDYFKEAGDVFKANNAAMNMFIEKINTFSKLATESVEKKMTDVGDLDFKKLGTSVGETTVKMNELNKAIDKIVVGVNKVSIFGITGSSSVKNGKSD